ncbi:MAG: DUF4097 family beta strand repeat-containing protein [Blastocatellia bacterium]|nr:DUF4097 family beta strand repeat-containing protein [Blastocatellia bacterium]
MSETCKYCGSGLLDGQRFCRFCGKPTDQFPEDNVPTQLMNRDTDPTNAWGAPGTASPLRSDTSPVYNPQPSYYQPPAYQAPMPPYAQPRPRSPWGWIIAFLGVGMVGVIILAMFLFAASSRSRRASGPPPEIELRSGENTLGRGRSEETKTFVLSGDSKFSIENPNGDIKIEGWDRPEAEVRIIKRGGSPRDRREAAVRYSEEGGNITLRTDPSFGPRMQIEYEVKLPRNLRQVEIISGNSDVEISEVNAAISINAQRGSISLSDIKGDISVDSQTGSIEVSDISGDIKASSRSGSIEMSDINGSVKTNSISGRTRVEFARLPEGKGLTFNSISGSIELEFQSPINAELEARTVSGRIDLDEEFGLNVDKQPPGQRASGPIGKGGPQLSISTTSGNIKVTK